MGFRRIFLKSTVFILLFIIFLGMGLFVGIKNSSDTIYQTLDIEGLDREVIVYRDDFGVPYIVGDTLRDLIFAQGYEFARDRTWQLEFYRSLINGELSALFGSSFVDTDKTVRSIGLKRATDNLMERLNSTETALIQAYVDGINTYYEQHPHNIPVELTIRGLTPQPWQLTDPVAMGSIVAFTFAFGGLTDEIRWAKAIADFGMEKTLQLFPVDYQPAVDYLTQVSDVNITGTNSLVTQDMIKTLEFAFGEATQELLEGYHSNNWVVSGDKTESGNPIVANDPHTSLEAQGIWYRVNLFSTDGEIYLQGFTFPGVPLLAFGHNKHIAWGATSGILDALDLFYLKENGTHYVINNSTWVPFEVVEETIEVLGGEDVEHVTRISEFGPMMQTELGEFAASWTVNQGYDRDLQIKSLLGFNLARTIDEFTSALEGMLTGFNFVFASLDGEIGYQNTGFIPDRKNGFGLIPKNGSNGQNGWEGLIDYEDMLRVLNPPEGFFATANERVDDRENFYISEEYAIGYRNARIEEVLSSAIDFDADASAFTLQDMMDLQIDVKTLAAAEVLDPVLDVIQSTTYRGDNADLLNEWKTKMGEWDHYLDVDSVEALIFITYRVFLVDSTFKDELGDLANAYIFKGIRQLSNWFANDMDNVWFDDTTTTAIETGTEIAIQAFERTIDYLVDTFGSNTRNWEYGDKHRVTLVHLFNAITPVLNIGGRSAGGSSFTVNALAGPRWNGEQITYETSTGPYFRMVMEVEPTWQNIWGVASSGASGNPLSPHYDDAYDDWISYDYSLWSVDLDEIDDELEKIAVMRRETS